MSVHVPELADADAEGEDEDDALVEEADETIEADELAAEAQVVSVD